MSERKITLSFRRKDRSCSTVKVYVTVRRPGEHSPKQLHLGYLPAREPLSEGAKRRLERQLRTKGRELFGSTWVTIDWSTTEQKWKKQDEPKQASVNREAAREQLWKWRSEAREELLPDFGGPQAKASGMETEAFNLEFMKSYEGIQQRLRRRGQPVDSAQLQTWWEEREAPRLLCCYRRLVDRRPDLVFGREGFLRYLAGNIARGFAAAQFLRENGARFLPLRGHDFGENPGEELL